MVLNVITSLEVSFWVCVGVWRCVGSCLFGVLLVDVFFISSGDAPLWRFGFLLDPSCFFVWSSCSTGQRSLY